MQNNTNRIITTNQYKAKRVFQKHYSFAKTLTISFFSMELLFARVMSMLFAFKYCFFLAFFLLLTAIHLTHFHALAEESKQNSYGLVTEKNSNDAKSRFDSQQKDENILDKEQLVHENENTKNSLAQSITPPQDEKITQTLKPIPSSGLSWWKYFQAVGTMLFLLLVLWYTLKIIRKYGNGRFLPSQKLLPKDAMYIEGQLSLGPNRYVAVVNILDRRLILGITEKNITLLTEMVNNEEPDLTKSFHEHISAAAANESHSAPDSSHTSAK